MSWRSVERDRFFRRGKGTQNRHSTFKRVLKTFKRKSRRGREFWNC